MNLISLVFLAFCLITLLIYFVIPKKIQWCVLLISSIVFLFYGNLSLNAVWQFIIIVATSYIFSILIDKYRDTKKSKIFLLVGIFIILGQLAYLKYSNLIITTFNQILKLLGIEHTFELVQRNSILGISYYSLIMIGYLVDIYRGACKPQENILKTVLFMSYFPILNSGPFIRYNETGEEIFKEHKFN